MIDGVLIARKENVSKAFVILSPAEMSGRQSVASHLPFRRSGDALVSAQLGRPNLSSFRSFEGVK